VEAGAGVRLPQRARPDAIRAAVERAISDPALRDGASRMKQAFTRDGASQAVSLLEEMASAGDPPGGSSSEATAT
jgi:UDP:flavonoid glycosyltransferase YjiC (YdhE family)